MQVWYWAATTRERVLLCSTLIYHTIRHAPDTEKSEQAKFHIFFMLPSEKVAAQTYPVWPGEFESVESKPCRGG